jgi:iron/zinc/copper transport system ATP-binding protein
MLKFQQISASYDGIHQAVDKISFTVEKPAIVGIIGPNGAGKSTFIKAALHLISNTGETTIDGQPLKTVQKKIAYVEQKTAIDYTFPITVRECVSLGLYPQKTIFQLFTKNDWQKVDAALDLVKMSEFKERQIGELSGGQFQRVLIARTLVQDASYIFLDEPFVGIDATSEGIIMDLLQNFKAQGKIIFIVHHDLSKVEEYFDELVILNKELIAYGPTQEVFTEKNLVAAFGDSIFIRGGRLND